MNDSTAPTPIRTAGSLGQQDKSSGGGNSCFVCELMSFQSGLQSGWQIIRRAEPAQLQRAQIGDGRPSVLRRHERSIGDHGVLSAGDRVENLAVGHYNDARIDRKSV